MARLRTILLSGLILTLLGAVACSSSSEVAVPEPTPSPAAVSIGAGNESNPGTASADTPTTAPDRNAAVAPTVTSTIPPAPTAPLTAQEKEAVDIMWEMINQFGEANETAVLAAGRNGHRGLVPVLVEAAGRTFDVDLAREIARALEKITGETVGGDFVLVAPWYSWMSKQEPPQEELKGYDSWRGQVLGFIDPNFKLFIHADVPARIPLWTVQWGGVVRDGIPPLEFPKSIAATDVDFLLADEPVFGVTINGESRAYPHRIMGWHELANDRLGGELITFVF